MEVYRPEDAFAINLRTFKLFGVWPSSIKHPLLSFIYKLYGYAIHFYYIGGLLPSQFTSMYIMRTDLKELVDSSFFTLTCVGYASKLVVFLFRRKKIEQFFQRLHDPIFVPRRIEHLNIMKKSAITGRASSITFLSLSLGTCVLWIVFPLVENREVKTLLYAAWYPYNATVNPAYAFTYISQTILLLTTAAMNSMIDIMTTNFYVVMVGQMEILKQDFRELTDFVAVSSNKNKNLVVDKSLRSSHSLENVFYYNEKVLDNILNDRIIQCLLRYQAIIKFVNDVTNFFEIGIVVQVCVSSFIICATTFEITLISPTTVQFYMYFLYQLCMLYQIFIYTWRGNDITIKTAELKNTVYECGWMSIPNKKFRKSICIIMSHLQVPLTICVGKFFLLSVDTFFKIIKMSYTFYILLKQVHF
ncbi:odorant receptor Or2-like [Leptopilina boulardi]|uniref:odorant receptor Or2-like n=1 Tax=Leptopilina boulardi TaxID=63433 RepID=UPI0021F4FF76|nr:odorant receptor Or2-like [Leptopilina boulardi]